MASITVTTGIDLDGNKVTGSGTPTEDDDLATKEYVDSVAGGGGPITADNITDATTVGKALIRATDAAAGRSAISAASAADLDNVFTIATGAEPSFGTPGDASNMFLLARSGTVSPTRGYIQVSPTTVSSGIAVQRTTSGQILVPNTPSANGHAASKQYVDGIVASFLGGLTGASNNGYILSTDGAGAYSWVEQNGASFTILDAAQEIPEGSPANSVFFRKEV